jgi:hypothetical protein
VSHVRRLWRLFVMRPTTCLHAVCNSLVLLVTGIVVGLLAGQPDGWMLKAGACSGAALLAGLLFVASRPD